MDFTGRKFTVNSTEYICVRSQKVLLQGPSIQYQLTFEPGNRKLFVNTDEADADREPELDDAIDNKIASFLLFGDQTGTITVTL
jgi:hypothetical protein